MRLVVLFLIPTLLVVPTPCSPRDVDDELANRIDRIMQSRAGAGEFSGSVLVVRQGHVIYERGFGMANREWNVPNDVKTKFEIGSMTKQFTAVLVLQFVNEGKIRLDGHLSDYLPSFYRKDTKSRVTIAEKKKLVLHRGWTAV